MGDIRTTQAEPCAGWGLKFKWRNANEFGLIHQTFYTRADAIRHYNKIYGDPSAYRKDRRTGQVLAVRVFVQEQSQ